MLFDGVLRVFNTSNRERERERERERAEDLEHISWPCLRNIVSIKFRSITLFLFF
jgi:hypothetical protein